ncbi:MAG: 3'-5' exonuclease [Fibromonadaceae bacterium]|jgi:DNA polymerase III epsilon subunit family exonuclease|nr:3'-5' exonuclease [Fibromonadaceae bacterium]
MSAFVKIIAFDLETTGLDAAKEEIIEIGAILFSVKESKGCMVQERLGEFQSFVKASKPIPERASDVNKITNEMISNAPSCAEILQKFKTFCEGANYLVAHNAPFDIGFLNVAYGKHSISAPANIILDSIKIFRNTIQLPDYKLGTIAKAFDSRNEISLKIASDSMHRALYDCEMLMHALVAILRSRLSNEEWAEREFLQALKKKDIYGDRSVIKPIKPKVSGLF